MKTISLIICTRNRDNMITAVFESLITQTLPMEKFEVIITDQSTNDKTQKLAENYPSFKYIKLNSTGASISRNEALKHATGEILVFIDDDVLFEPNYLENILEFFETSELKPDMLGGKTILKFLGDKPEWLDGALLGALSQSNYGDKPLILDSHPKHVPYTCNMAIKRECLEKIGTFSEFFHINEDVLFAHNAKNARYKIVYNPKMFVYHRMPAERLTYAYFKNKYYLHGKYDAHLYYTLKMFKKNEIPFKLTTHIERMFSGLLLQYFKTIPADKYYQKLRFYYNIGYVGSLIKILFAK